MTIFKLTTGAVTASMIAVTALAHGGATGVVKERMDGMSAMKDSIKVLTPMMQGKEPYDEDTVRREAEKLEHHAGEAMTKLFPEGSDGMPSEAKPEIWQDWDAFSELADQLHTYAEGLALAAGNGLMMSGSGQGAGMMAGGSMMGGSMMGSGMMMGGVPGREKLSEMPADGVFMMLSQTCSACHTRFRSE
ncbi:cytochrome c [Ruegeria sediminis]|uniref:Cytochrome c n=1 Tax=Ruegeria sediminis TaxID=2583820 RepID=A0ABY2X4N2_9RHOB|nr:cytochrome c [Ruegeria sediminis]TMV10004.1 cytochrome c [Ruegeria sediminis]